MTALLYTDAPFYAAIAGLCVFVAWYWGIRPVWRLARRWLP